MSQGSARRSIGTAVRRARDGRSQDSLAAAMRGRGYGWQQSTVANVEAGRRSLPLDEAVVLADVLAVTLADLVSDDDGGRAASRHDETEADPRPL